ncbi:MAG: hypothetical protein AMXMBFR77_19590 [Phycisphaerales bacterium]|nr:hypothetical protein [Phycisphaerales bacterium]GIK19625.1 MAG: hypothetical protein BroJett004_17890 [Planctomycetota bacterium]
MEETACGGGRATIRAAHGVEVTRGFPGDERIESGADEGGFFLDAGAAGGLFEGLLVDVERRSHVHFGMHNLCTL